MAFWMILFPIAMGLVSMTIPSNRWRPWMLPLTAVGHLAMTFTVLSRPELTVSAEWLVLDPPAKIVLLVVSIFFFLCSFYTVGYLQHRPERANHIFCACLMTLLGIMSLVIWSHHLGLMWVAIEATTLVSAPLIYFNRTQESIEATWKYLLVGSVGIALALLGTFFLAYSSLYSGLEATLTFEGLLQNAARMSKPWLYASFILLLIGYGTKMGLAPMHTWKPDAYGEASGVVGAIFAGCITSCAFLAVLRIYHICNVAGESVFVAHLLLFIGLFSMAVAGLFMIEQRDFKRLLAYSSVEHMGILVLGLGLGGPALFGTMLHIVTNGMTKGVLFLSAGNIHRAYGSKNVDHVRGAIRRLPLSGTLFLVGFLAITGSPPFGPFISEFSILNGAISSQQFIVGGLFLALLLLVFIAMGPTVFKVVQGRIPAEAHGTLYRDDWLTGAPVVIFMLLTLLLGLYIPSPLNTMLHDAVAFLEVRP